MPVEVQAGLAGRGLKLGEIVPCRETQAATVLALLGEPEQYSYPSIFIYGHQSTGKSHVTLTLLQELQLPHVVVSCVECFSAGLLFERVLVSLFGLAAPPLLRHSGFSDFVRLFHRLNASSAQPHQTLYVVLDRAELLRDMDANLLSGFLRLQEFVEDNVTVILLSEIVWEKFRPSTGCFEPLLLHFPDYNKAELQHILSQAAPSSHPPELYSTYINVLLGVFFAVCRDLRELSHLAVLNFPKFIEPLEKGEAKESDTHKLWKNIEPHLKRAMQSVYLREVSSVQWEKLQQQVEKGEAETPRAMSAHAHVELPYYSKFLLIAAYLSSFNPARTDRRFFLKHHGKIKTNFLKKHEKISSLVTLQLLCQVGHDDQLDSPKFKCAVSLDFICAVARTVGFDIIRYLYDFL
ncbi:origin recognition complex subunit 5 isoform X2 [Amia ocellicauda]|uniref:origin recognition complex subunit 5 isoform X2 n=1 Tax=Amia ocellicauda TaxID=2972642 RepID=UPI003464C780